MEDVTDWTVWKGWIELRSKSRLFWETRFLRIEHNIASFYKDDSPTTQALFSFELNKNYTCNVATPAKNKPNLLEIYHKSSNILRSHGVMGGIGGGISNGRRMLSNTASFALSLPAQALHNVGSVFGLGNKAPHDDSDSDDDTQNAASRYAGLLLSLSSTATLEILMIVLIQSINGDLRASEHFAGDVASNYHCGETLTPQLDSFRNSQLMSAAGAGQFRSRIDSSDESGGNNSEDDEDDGAGGSANLTVQAKANDLNTEGTQQRTAPRKDSADESIFSSIISGIGGIVSAPVQWVGRHRTASFPEEPKQRPMKLEMKDSSEIQAKRIGNSKAYDVHSSGLNEHENLEYLRNFALPLDITGKCITQRTRSVNLETLRAHATNSECSTLDNHDGADATEVLLQRGVFKRLLIVVYENQRFLPLAGFSSKNLFFTDPDQYSDWSGQHHFPYKVLERAPPPDGYRWSDVLAGWKISEDADYLFLIGDTDTDTDTGNDNKGDGVGGGDGAQANFERMKSPLFSDCSGANASERGECAAGAGAETYLIPANEILLAANDTGFAEFDGREDSIPNADVADIPVTSDNAATDKSEAQSGTEKLSKKGLRRASLQHIRRKMHEESVLAEQCTRTGYLVAEDEEEITTRGMIFERRPPVLPPPSAGSLNPSAVAEMSPSPGPKVHSWSQNNSEFQDGWIYAHRWNRFDAHVITKEFHFSEGKKDVVRRRRYERMCVKIE